MDLDEEELNKWYEELLEWEKKLVKEYKELWILNLFNKN